MMELTPQRLKQEMEKGTSFALVDVQPGHEYEHSHIPQAINIPFEEFGQSYESLLRDPKQVVVVYDEYDEMEKAKRIAEYLEQRGFSYVGRLMGGFMGWKNAGYITDGGIES